MRKSAVAFLLSLWFLLAFSATGQAAPVAGAIALISGVVAKGGIAAALLQAALGIAFKVGSSLIMDAIRGKQPTPGITGQLQVGGNNSVSFLVGDYATAGSLEYVGEWGTPGGTPNAFLVQVISVSDYPQGGIKPRIWVNGEKCTIDFGQLQQPGHPITEYSRNGTNYMHIAVHGGDQTSVDPYLMAAFAGKPERPFIADMIGTGLTYVVLTSYINRELLTSLPQIRVEPYGLPLYDPRKDSTVGGSGAHRWGNSATYETTANLAVIIYNIMRGIYYNGEKVFGMGTPGTRMPLANWFSAMNECDIPVLTATGYEPKFRAGYEIKVAEHQPLTVIQELLKGGNGKMVEVGGIYKLHLGAPSLPVMFLTDPDFLVSEDQELENYPGLENTFNGASATYPEPESGWEMKDAPQLLFPALELEDDGRQSLADFQFNAVPYATQVQRLMQSVVLDGRKFRKHRGVLGPEAFVLEPKDTISYTSVREGYLNKLFSVESIEDLDNCNQAVSFQETDPSDFDWNFSTDERPWSVGPVTPNWPAPIPMTGWFAVPSAILDELGRERRPAIDVQYAGDMEGIRSVQIQVRNALSQVVFEGEVPYGDRIMGQKAVRLSGEWCLPNEDYTIRGRFLTFGTGIETEWSSWLAVHTKDIKLIAGLDFDPYAGVIGFDQLGGDIANYLEWSGGGLKEIIRKQEELDLWIADQDIGNAWDRQELRKQLTATYMQSTAEWKYSVNLVATETVALASRIEELDAEVFDPVTGLPAIASAVDVLDAYAGPDGALANAITQLSASTTPGDVSEANFRMGVATGPTGYARIVFQTRVNGAGVWRGAAMGLDTPNNPALPTRFWVDAQQMVFADLSSGSMINPLIYDSGVWRMNVANIGTVTAGIIRSPDSRFVINLAAGSIEWFD